MHHSLRDLLHEQDHLAGFVLGQEIYPMLKDDIRQLRGVKHANHHGSPVHVARALFEMAHLSHKWNCARSPVDMDHVEEVVHRCRDVFLGI